MDRTSAIARGIYLPANIERVDGNPTTPDSLHAATAAVLRIGGAYRPDLAGGSRIACHTVDHDCRDRRARASARHAALRTQSYRSKSHARRAPVPATRTHR